MTAIATNPDGYLSSSCGVRFSAPRETFLPTEVQRRPRRSVPPRDTDALAFALSSRSFGSPQPLHVVMSGSLSLLASRRVISPRRRCRIQLSPVGGALRGVRLGVY